MNERRVKIAATLWQIGALLTFAKLTFFDDYPYNGWNWLVAIPVNAFLSEIWPIYWALLRWIT
jgi:hypothetical protein